MCLGDNIPYGSLPQFSQGSIDGPCDARDGWLVVFFFFFFFFRFLQLVFLIIPNVNVTKYFGLVGAILLQLVGVKVQVQLLGNLLVVQFLHRRWTAQLDELARYRHDDLAALPIDLDVVGLCTGLDGRLADDVGALGLHLALRDEAGHWKMSDGRSAG